MKFRYYLLLILPMLLLHLFAGCSDDSGGGNGEPVPSPGKIGNEACAYEANAKIIARTNALNAISARLDEIKSLGVIVFWLMPVYEQGVKDAVGSPYCVKDYNKLNADYGTEDDFKS